MEQPSKHTSKLVGLAFWSLLLIWGTARGAPTYTITDLGTLGGAASQAQGINNQGDVVGSAYTASGETHAFLYSNGRMRDLGSLDGFISTAQSISNQRVVVGAYVRTVKSYLPDGEWLTLLYSNGRTRNFLGFTPGQILGVNGRGEMSGWFATEQAQRHAFFYSGGRATDLGTLGGTYSMANSINDRSQVVGWADTGDEARHAFLYSSGEMADLGTLGGTHSVATAVNILGEVVGWADTSSENHHAFLYSAGEMVDLGTLGGSSSQANGLNKVGMIVGSSTIGTAPTAPTHAFLYNGDTMVDLNSLIPPESGWTLVDAAGINDAGRIAATGTDSLGIGHALLLSPRQSP